MKRIFFSWFSAFGICLLFFTGCVSDYPSDISLTELREHMIAAMDPEQKYCNAEAYWQRQNIEEEGFWSVERQLVEVRFQRPDKFKFSYYKENKVNLEILYANGAAWVTNYEDCTVNQIEGEALNKLRVMTELGHPDTDYQVLFERVELFLTKLTDGKEYYKLICYFKDAPNPVTIYVDKTTYLPQRMELDLVTPQQTIHCVNDILKYQTFDTVKVPVLTHVEEGEDKEYDTRVVGYILNPVFRKDEFAVPTFDPVLKELQLKKQSK